MPVALVLWNQIPLSMPLTLTFLDGLRRVLNTRQLVDLSSCRDYLLGAKGETAEVSFCDFSWASRKALNGSVPLKFVAEFALLECRGGLVCEGLG